MDKIIFYGIGHHFLKRCKEIRADLSNIIAFADKNAKSMGNSFFEIPIICPEDIPNYNYDKIVISSPDYYDEIYAWLTEKLSVPASAIEFIDNYYASHINKPNFFSLYTRLGYERMLSQIQESGQLSAESLKECRVLENREEALLYMPKGAVAAEIGVAYGGFSEEILKTIDPKKFYAIDYFNQDDPYISFWGCDFFKRDDMPHQKWYEHRFKNEIDEGIVEVVQGLSWECLSEFPDDFFDYAYVDASHDYNSVLKDIEVLQHKMKCGGYVQFNDYLHLSPTDNNYFGVIPAVNRFVNRGGHDVVFYCLYPTGYNDIVIRVKK